MSVPIRDIQTLFEAGPLAGLADGPLLERFAARRDEAAFEAIIRRHGPMVLGVCRRVLRDRHDAEDAFQATFLVLARRASAIAHGERLGPWLYGVALRTATKSRTTRTRRQGREGRVADLPEPEAPEEGGDDDRIERLDREIGRLPDRYRIPVVLCELEGMSHRAAAEQLGWPIGTVSGRLSRARSLLGERLSRRDPVPPGSPLSAWLAVPLSPASLSTRLVGPTARAAGGVAAGRTIAADLVSAEVATLTREVLRTMILGKCKFMASSALAAAVLVGGVGVVYRVAMAAGDPAPEKPSAPLRVKERPAEPAQPKVAVSPATPAPAPVPAADPMASYPFRLDPDRVYEFPELTVASRDVRLVTGPVLVVPILTERGITGAMLIGSGTYRYTPEATVAIAGEFRAAMLRFNPEEQEAILPLGKGKPVSDLGTTEMCRQLLQVAIRHCWQSNKDGGRRQEVLIPTPGAFAAVLYSKEHGDLLLSGDAKTATAFSFTSRKSLYEKK